MKVSRLGNEPCQHVSGTNLLLPASELFSVPLSLSSQRMMGPTVLAVTLLVPLPPQAGWPPRVRMPSWGPTIPGPAFSGHTRTSIIFGAVVYRLYSAGDG